MPGNIRKAGHFIGFMQRVLGYVKEKMGMTRSSKKVIEIITPKQFLDSILKMRHINQKTL